MPEHPPADVPASTPEGQPPEDALEAWGVRIDWDRQLPAIAEGMSPVAAELGVVKRPDGSNQVTYKGIPLYSFTQEGPDEVTGDGFADAFGGRQFTWNVVSVGNASGSADTSSSTSSGPAGY